MRTFEGCLIEEDEFSLSFWINSLFTTYHTMLGTGYSISYPYTYFGKFVSFLTGILGYVIFSMIIIIFVEFMEFKGIKL